MNIKEIPDIFVMIGYIPAQLLFRKNEFPNSIKVGRSIWDLNIWSCVPFYEPRDCFWDKQVDKL